MRRPDPLRVRDLVGHMADAERRLRELGDFADFRGQVAAWMKKEDLI